MQYFRVKLLINGFCVFFSYRFFTNSGLKWLRIKFTVNAPAYMHKPAKLIQASVCKHANS